MSGYKGGQRVPHKKKPLSHGWIVVTSKTYPDRVYFFNTVTKCSTWNNPCESINNEECESSSSESSSPVTHKSSRSSSKKQRRNLFIHSPDKNRNKSFNIETEDWEEQQDGYFGNHTDPLGLTPSNFISPSNSPGSALSENISDSEKYSGSDVLLENNKKQLWVHFVSSSGKLSGKKSLALTDFDGPTTSTNLEMEPTNERERQKPKSSSKETGKSFFSTVNNNERFNKDINSFTGENLRKKQSNKKKTVTEKSVKNISFKRVDKTPAQTRLLKLRKQNAEKLKELAAKFPDFVIPKSNGAVDGSLKKFKNSGTSDTDGQTKNDAFGEAYLKRIEIFSNSQNEKCPAEGDYIEEMDWEPSNVESDVKNINVLRQQLSKTSEISSDIFFGLSADHSLTLPLKNSLILVLDTNIFVSCLDFIKEIRDTKIQDFGYPIIYVCWRTLQELDHLKDTKIDLVDRHIHTNVRRAIAYLNDNFKSRHPRIFGQSFEDFAKMVDIETFAPDDEILQTCIYFQKQNADKKLILLTNDKNLESKAIISGVEAYSKDRFMTKYLNTRSDLPAIRSALNPSTNADARVDECLCEVKVILKDFLPMFVETEMRIAFEGDWIKVAFRKPPWTLQDALECLLKHWRSVFFLIFSKETRSEAENLHERLFKREPVTIEDIVEVIRTIQRFLVSVKKYQKKKRPYLDLIPVTITKLSNLMRTIAADNSPKDVTAVPASTIPSISHPDDSLRSREDEERAKEDVAKVRNLFKDLWDYLRSFCCSISDVIHSSGSDSEAALQNIKMKVSQILSEVGELLNIVERIFQMDTSDISESHPLISHFSSFLIHIYPSVTPELKDELPRCLASFFTDFEGRSLLGSSLNDFKEFVQDLSKAIEYFETQLPC